MRLRVAWVAMGAALLLTGMATTAHAAPSDLLGAPVSDNQQPSPFYVPTPHKTYSFDAKGRWGVNLDMEQLVNRDTQWKDVTAGAYFKIGPRLKLGGSVGLGDKLSQPQQLTPQDLGPRVHLETKFQF
jgi:hypothetical protein